MSDKTKWAMSRIGDNHDMARKVFTWGTYGKNGDLPLRRVLIKDMSNEHIEACLELEGNDEYYTWMFRKELEGREAGTYPNVEDTVTQSIEEIRNEETQNE